MNPRVRRALLKARRAAAWRRFDRKLRELFPIDRLANGRPLEVTGRIIKVDRERGEITVG